MGCVSVKVGHVAETDPDGVTGDHVLTPQEANDGER